MRSGSNGCEVPHRPGAAVVDFIGTEFGSRHQQYREILWRLSFIVSRTLPQFRFQARHGPGRRSARLPRSKRDDLQFTAQLALHLSTALPRWRKVPMPTIHIGRNLNPYHCSGSERAFRRPANPSHTISLQSRARPLLDRLFEWRNDDDENLGRRGVASQITSPIAPAMQSRPFRM